MDTRRLGFALLSAALVLAACGDDGSSSSVGPPGAGGGSLEVEVAIQGPGILEIEFTTPAAGGSFTGHDLFVDTVAWSIGQTSVLRVAGTLAQEGGTVDLDMDGPVVRGTVKQSPWGTVTMYVDGTIHDVEPGRPFALSR